MHFEARWHSYLAEDFVFCERARPTSIAIQADTPIRVWHLSTYRYGWEDAGRDVDRFGDFAFHQQSAKVPPVDVTAADWKHWDSVRECHLLSS